MLTSYDLEISSILFLFLLSWFKVCLLILDLEEEDEEDGDNDDDWRGDTIVFLAGDDDDAFEVVVIDIDILLLEQVRLEEVMDGPLIVTPGACLRWIRVVLLVEEEG